VHSPTGSDHLALVLDVPITIAARLGSRVMTLREVLELGPEAVIELDRDAGGPVDVLAKERLVARGEIVAVDESYGVRITELVDPAAWTS
jgi:flagellar motor switch protein FliN/FliY